jgi:hypothetical protein
MTDLTLFKNFEAHKIVYFYDSCFTMQSNIDSKNKNKTTGEEGRPGSTGVAVWDRDGGWRRRMGRRGRWDRGRRRGRQKEEEEGSGVWVWGHLGLGQTQMSGGFTVFSN